MPIDATELRRLHKLATSKGGSFASVEYAAKDRGQKELNRYLTEHVPEILSALADRDRLEWLQENSADTIYMDDGGIVDIGGQHEGNIRAAIDAAMCK